MPRSPRTPVLVSLVLCLAPAVATAFPNMNPIGTYGLGHITSPTGIAINAAGETYVVSPNSYHVDKYSRSGNYMLTWGSQGTGQGQFSYPTSLAVDTDGYVYVADVAGNRVQKFSPTGFYLSGFGTSGTGPGQFDQPRGIAIDASGSIYVTDSYNHRVQKFDANGSYQSEWGTQGTDPGQFDQPWGIAIDAAGDVYVVDSYNHRVQKFTSSGAFVRMWGSEGSGDGQFEYPSGVTVDGSGNVFVSDANNHRVEWFTSTGVFVAKWGSYGTGVGQFIYPAGMTTRYGDVYVTDTEHRVQIFRSRNNQGHESIVTWGSAGGDPGQFSAVMGVGVASDGSVYVTDRLAGNVQKFTSTGVWVTSWGTLGSGDGEFNQPTGVAVDASGDVYVVDHLNSRVQRFSSTGTYLGQWGSPAQFTAPWDIAIDAADHVYVTDANRVQKFSTTGIFLNSWICSSAHGIGVDGEGYVYVACYDDDVVRKYGLDGSLTLEWGGTGANPGQFDHPTDVAADTAGYVYVCENVGNRIQKFTPLGGFVAFFGEPGSGFRQIDAPQSMAIDGPGSLYVTEFSNYRVHKFASAPELLEIADVPGDEGGWATVRFTRSSAEAPNSGALPTAYKIYRWEQYPPAIIEVASIPVGDPSTTALIQTGGHATDVFTGMKEYEVRLQPNVQDSGPIREFNDGFSVDNLAPPAPSPFTAGYAYPPEAVALHWDVSPAADFSQFRLYRAETESFTLTPATLIHASPDTGYSDEGPLGRYYKIVAADTSGNVSEPAALGPNDTVSAPEEASTLAFRLEDISPNPAHGSALYVRFSLPDARAARVELINVAGRRVWSREVLGAGPHVLRVDAGLRLASGIYFVKLTREDQSVVRRVALVD